MQQQQQQQQQQKPYKAFCDEVFYETEVCGWCFIVGTVT